MENTSKNPAVLLKFLPWLAAGGIFMQTLDSTILNTALPDIAKDLNESPLQMQSIVISYALVLALFIPLSGWMSDKFGSRKIFMIAVALFTLGSLFSALSPTLNLLVISRIIQACGASMMVPVSRLAILYTYPKDQLLNVMNFITIPGLVGPVIGPALGGWLTETASWHWVFLINIPLGIIGVFAAYKVMPNYKMKSQRFDLAGMLLFGSSLVSITMAMDMGAHKIINYWWIIGLFITGVVLMELYYIHYKKIKNPLINLALIKIRTFRIGVFGNLLTRLGIGGMPFLLPLLFQIGYKQSALVSGFMLIPSALSGVLAKSWVVPLVKKLGYKKTLISNTILISMIIIAFAIPGQHTPLPALIPLLVIYGAVNSIQMTSMNTLALSDLDQHNAATGNSLLMVMQQLSLSLGVSVSAFLLSQFEGIPNIIHQGIITVFRYTFWVMGALTLLSSLLFFRLKSTDGNNLTAP